MDSLQEIIKNLKKEEIRNFKIFTKRFQRQEDIKISTLFDLLRSGKYEEDEKGLVAQLFPQETNPANAYYRLKNRLKNELEKSLVNLHHNLDEKIGTINYITLSSIFSYKAQYELALHYLKKAEKTALQNEFYDLLDFVYSQIVELSSNFNFDEINPIEYIEKRNENARKNSLFMEVNNAIAAVTYSLRKVNLSKSEDINQALQSTLKELNIASEIYNIPNVKLKINTVIRNVLLQNKDFERLEKYLKESLNEFEENKIFTKSTHNTKIALITWIINTLIVNKKWEESIAYTEELLIELNKFNKLYYENFIWTYYQSLITSYISSNQLDNAIKLLEEIMEESADKGVPFYEYFIHGSLALCYYYKANNSESIKILSRLFLKDVYPKLSNELQLSISILEIVLHYDNHNLDYVTYRIGELKRQFRALLKAENHVEDKAFIKLVSNLADKPDPMHDKQMITQMTAFVANAAPYEIGTGKPIDSGLWVTAKLNHQHYYTCLLQALKP